MLVREMVGRLDELLNYPRPQTPTRLQRLNAVGDAIQRMLNALNNTPVPRQMDSVLLSATPGTESVVVTAANFGQPLYCVTENTNVEREVEIVLPQNLPKYSVGGIPGGGGNGLQQDAVAMAIVKEGNVLVAKFRPIPTGAGDYRLFYKVGTFNATPGAEPPLPQFHQWLVANAGLSLLGKCLWDDPKTNNEKRELIRQDLMFLKTEDEANFHKFKVQNAQAKSTRRLAHGEEYDLGPLGTQIGYFWAG